ncbi:MAG: hypothetical protein M1834_000641 [Cirrosporium novae-zelandiae]|nr:MAG: hypothetical protein M1834_000641 [Cirrosporium novae-zelandiae]
MATQQNGQSHSTRPLSLTDLLNPVDEASEGSAASEYDRYADIAKYCSKYKYLTSQGVGNEAGQTNPVNVAKADRHIQKRKFCSYGITELT